MYIITITLILSVRCVATYWIRQCVKIILLSFFCVCPTLCLLQTKLAPDYLKLPIRYPIRCPVRLMFDVRLSLSELSVSWSLVAMLVPLGIRFFSASSPSRAPCLIFKVSSALCGLVALADLVVACLPVYTTISICNGSLELGSGC